MFAANRRLPQTVFLSFISIAVASSAFAHSGAIGTESFASGFFHPITGLDHVVAMIAVGIWGAVLGNPATWILPVAFPLMMTIGGAIGISGVELPLVETVIALSGVVMGLLVVFYVRTPIVSASLLVGVFAIFHGYAHGTELPVAANPIGYSVGFVTGTGLLHMAGIAVGLLDYQPLGRKVIRALGATIAAVGLYFLIG